MIDENEVGVDRFKVTSPNPQVVKAEVGKDVITETETMAIPEGRDIKKEKNKWKTKKGKGNLR